MELKAIYRHLKTQPFPILVVMGVTASGKTELAIQLAKLLEKNTTKHNITGAEIISSDSVQVYKGLDIGSAKPKIHQLQAVPHHLIGILKPTDFYSAGRFVLLAEEAIKKIYKKNKIPILVAGNMLYVFCLIDGMANIPSIPQSIKSQVKDLYQRSLQHCYQKLIQLDPLSKEFIVPKDKLRVLRALEVFLAHKKSIFTFQQNQQKRQKYSPFYLGIDIEKEVMNERINQRIFKMLKEGFVEEVKNLLTHYSVNTIALQSIGYKQVVDFLQGKIKKQEMITQIQLKTKQYAKRQRTWQKKITHPHWIKIGIESYLT